jgi:hypothetical protein
MTCLWHESMSYDVGVCELIWYYEVIYKMMLVPFFQWLESPRQAVSHHVMLTMQNGFTICPFTRPSERLTGLDNGLRHDVYTLEKENIDAILHMDWPCNATELCMFIGYVNYYRTCCRVVHISLNLIDLWFDNLLHGQTKCRNHLYNVYACGCKSIACPNHNKWFRIHTNASDFQLGTCIIQEGRLVAYFSCNWQCHSTTILHWKSKYFPS